MTAPRDPIAIINQLVSDGIFTSAVVIDSAEEDCQKCGQTHDLAEECACFEHWHCNPVYANHECSRPDRGNPCPGCGEEPEGPDGWEIAEMCLPVWRREKRSEQ